MAGEKAKIKSNALRVLFDHIAVAEHKAGLPALKPIKRSIDFAPTLEVAMFMHRMVKDEGEREAFFADPKGVLAAHNLQRETRSASQIVRLVKDIVERAKGGRVSEVFDSYSSSETKSHQHTKWDSSGRSAETNKESIVGEDHKFDGFGLVEEIFSNPDLGRTFFPNQPLVTPQLVDQIRARLPETLGGVKAGEVQQKVGRKKRG